MAILKEIFLLFVAGLVLYLAFTIGLLVSGIVVGFLPLGALGMAGEILGIILMIALMGFVGRYVLRFMPN